MENATNTLLRDATPGQGTAGPMLKERVQAVLRTGPDRPHVLAPIRLESTAEELRLTLEMAASLRPGARVTLLHVLSASPPEPSFHWLDAIDQLHRAQSRQRVLAVEQARTVIARRVEEVVPTDLRSNLALEAECRVGEPAEEIARFANEQAVDLVILCNDRGGWRWPLWPRLSERVLRLTSKPVVLVHPPAERLTSVPS